MKGSGAPGEGVQPEAKIVEESGRTRQRKDDKREMDKKNNI